MLGMISCWVEVSGMLNLCEVFLVVLGISCIRLVVLILEWVLDMNVFFCWVMVKI